MRACVFRKLFFVSAVLLLPLITYARNEPYLSGAGFQLGYTRSFSPFHEFFAGANYSLSGYRKSKVSEPVFTHIIFTNILSQYNRTDNLQWGAGVGYNFMRQVSSTDFGIVTGLAGNWFFNGQGSVSLELGVTYMFILQCKYSLSLQNQTNTPVHSVGISFYFNRAPWLVALRPAR
ncbi:MAG: hypothetical protein MUC87_19330 [Bacteroidia bacterium]|jgi:hypothetical protein|nr:hypothetical protein [Bacteroidia bacterium]